MQNSINMDSNLDENELYWVDPWKSKQLMQPERWYDIVLVLQKPIINLKSFDMVNLIE